MKVKILLNQRPLSHKHANTNSPAGNEDIKRTVLENYIDFYLAVLILRVAEDYASGPKQETLQYTQD